VVLGSDGVGCVGGASGVALRDLVCLTEDVKREAFAVPKNMAANADISDVDVAL
jgi:hypothetical protein